MLLRRLAAAAVDRYLLPAGPTPAHPPQRATDETDRRTDTVHYIDRAAYYNVNNVAIVQA